MSEWEALVGGAFPFIGSIAFVIIGNAITHNRSAALFEELNAKADAIRGRKKLTAGFEPERMQLAAQQVSDLAQVFPSLLLTAFGAALVTVVAESDWLRLVTVAYMFVAVAVAIYLWAKYSDEEPYAYNASGAFGLSPPSIATIAVNVVGLVLMGLSKL